MAMLLICTWKNKEKNNIIWQENKLNSPVGGVSIFCWEADLCSAILPGGWAEKFGGTGLFEWELVWLILKLFIAFAELERGTPGTGEEEIPPEKFPDAERECGGIPEAWDEFEFKGLFTGPFINVCGGAETFTIGDGNLFAGDPIGGGILCIGDLFIGGGVPWPFKEELYPTDIGLFGKFPGTGGLLMFCPWTFFDCNPPVTKSINNIKRPWKFE